MISRPRTARTTTALDRFRRSRFLASTTLFTTLLSLLGPLVPGTAFAGSAPSNPGSSGASLGGGNSGIQQGQTDLGVPETGPAATLQPNWSVDPSTGAFSASVPFLLPQARGAVQPALALVYSSSGGQGAGGLGWSLSLPDIERHNPSGSPQYDDPHKGGEISTDAGAPVEDWFTYGGASLVPICLVGSGGRCAPVANGNNPVAGSVSESMPTWATGGWHYYRLEVETGSNLRFFWSPTHETWVVQEPNGSTMEFGVPQDNPSDTGGVDIDNVATAAEAGDGGTGLPAVFRWNLVRHYDTARAPGSPHPTNPVVFAWSKLPETSLFLGSTTPVGTSPISDLTDIYDTPPVATSYPSTASYAHHTHLNYTTSFNTNSTRVDRARHANYLTGVDVTSATFAGGTNREQVRRYVLSYTPSGHQLELSKVQLDGWCSSGDPTEVGNTGLLPPEPSSGPACGTDGTWAPWTSFTYTAAGFSSTYAVLSPTFNARPPQPPGLFDVNSDGLPDLVDSASSSGLPKSQLAYLNSAPPAATINTWTQLPLTLDQPGALLATSAGMQPFALNYASAAFRNTAQLNGVWFNSLWTTTTSAGQALLSGATSAGVGAQLYSPVSTGQPPTSYDWGAPVSANIASVFPGCLQNCGQYWPIGNNGCSAIDACLPGSMFLGCDEPFATLDINGDGLQDLLVSRASTETARSLRSMAGLAIPTAAPTLHPRTARN